MSISKKDLSNSLKTEANISTEHASIFIETFFQSLSESFQKNQTIKISGFGTFTKFNTKPRVGRNPKTMQSFPIPSKQKIKFKTSSKVKEMLN
tara:strand:+ start:4418 stop:4696 length:279 start_codon:yes stop_codon:yes gene_type:complete